MLSKKNKDLRTIKEGVVGKYVKKETPPEMSSTYLENVFLSTLVSPFLSVCRFLRVRERIF